MAADPITAGLDLANTLVNRFWPDKTDQEKQELAGTLMLLQGQLKVNEAEAGSSSLFVAGWRPAVGWTCALAFFFKFCGGPLMFMVAQAFGKVITLPAVDYSELWPILLGMLGLGAYRTFEKVNGVAK